MEGHGASPHLWCYRISVDSLIAPQLEVNIVHDSKFGLTPHTSQSYKTCGGGGWDPQIQRIQDPRLFFGTSPQRSACASTN